MPGISAKWKNQRWKGDLGEIEQRPWTVGNLGNAEVADLA